MIRVIEPKVLSPYLFMYLLNNNETGEPCDNIFQLWLLLQAFSLFRQISKSSEIIHRFPYRSYINFHCALTMKSITAPKINYFLHCFP